MFSSIVVKNKKNLIFLHGWGGSWQSWFPILEKLKKDFNLFAPDLPGFGKNLISKPYNLDDYVDYVVEYIQKNKIEKPILIGHSFGGGIICKIVIDQKIAISKIILVDAAAIRHPHSLLQKINIVIIGSIKKILSLPLINKILPSVQKTYYYFTRQQNSDYATLKDDPIMQQTFKNIIQHDLTKELPKIKTPTLIIWGELDLSTLLIDGQKIHQLIPNSEFISYPKTTHFSYLEEQERFIKDIKKFIEK